MVMTRIPLRRTSFIQNVGNAIIFYLESSLSYLVVQTSDVGVLHFVTELLPCWVQCTMAQRTIFNVWPAFRPTQPPILNRMANKYWPVVSIGAMQLGR